MNAVLLAIALLGADPMPVETFITDVVAIKDQQNPNATIVQRKAAEVQAVQAVNAKHRKKPFQITVSVTGLKGPYTRDNFGRVPYEIFHEPLTWGNDDGVKVVPLKFLRVPLTAEQANALKVGSKVTVTGTLELNEGRGFVPQPGVYRVPLGQVIVPENQKGLSLALYATALEIDN